MLDPSAWLALVISGWSDLGQTEFWVALVKIMWINVLLSGDNALVIAMACQGLPPKQRLWGMILGAGVAVLLRIVFTGVVASLMLLPYLKIVGGLALFYIAAKLLVPDDPDEGEAEAVDHLWRAVRIIAVADIIMSLDNVIAIAAAAGGNMALVVLGLAISIPLIVAGAALIMALLDRFPILVWAGAAPVGGALCYSLRSFPDRVLISADLDEHAAHIQKFVDMGFDEVHLHNVGRNQAEFIKAFGEKVLPQLRLG